MQWPLDHHTMQTWKQVKTTFLPAKYFQIHTSIHPRPLSACASPRAGDSRCLHHLVTRTLAPVVCWSSPQAATAVLLHKPHKAVATTYATSASQHPLAFDPVTRSREAFTKAILEGPAAVEQYFKYRAGVRGYSVDPYHSQLHSVLQSARVIYKQAVQQVNLYLATPLITSSFRIAIQLFPTACSGIAEV